MALLPSLDGITRVSVPLTTDTDPPKSCTEVVRPLSGVAAAPSALVVFQMTAAVAVMVALVQDGFGEKLAVAVVDGLPGKDGLTLVMARPPEV